MGFTKPAYSLLAAWALAATAPAFPSSVTAGQVLDNCLASYEAAKSYQGTLVIVTDIGGRRERMTLIMKAEIDGKGKVLRSATAMTHVSGGTAGSHTATEKQIDNGTTILTLRPDLKQYSQRPHAS